MRDGIGYAMSTTKAVEFLEQRGHGVLSMADDDRGYGIPVSYGYDEEAERLVLEFVYAGESKKREFVRATAEATLCTYEHVDVETWASVVVTGRLEPIPAEDVSERDAALFFSQAGDAAGERRWTDAEPFDREWLALRIDDVSGRHGSTHPHAADAP